MAFLKKKEKKADAAAPKASVKPAPVKQPKPNVSPDVYTLLLGLAALFFIVATVVLGLNYYWYQIVEPAVVPLNWLR